MSELLVSNGTATRGIIVECTFNAGNSCKTDPYWHVLIAYKTPARLDRKVRLDKKRRVGDTLTVFYLLEAPEIALLYES